MYKKILVPLDGSPLSEAALPHAKALARLEGAEIVILRVPEHIEPKFPAQEYAHSMRQQREAEAEAEGYVENVVATLNNNEHIKAEGYTRAGPVPTAILQAAEETQADMIAMSTHGRAGVKRLVLGSVAEDVVHHAHIPVMLIHPN